MKTFKVPKVDALVKTPHGNGTVIYVSLLEEKVVAR